MALEDAVKRLQDINKNMWPETAQFTKPAISHMLNVLLEESGELAGAFRSYFGRKYSPEKVAAFSEIEGELGDVLGTALVICMACGCDFEKILNITTTKLEQRAKITRDERAQKKWTDVPRCIRCNGLLNVAGQCIGECNLNQ